MKTHLILFLFYLRFIISDIEDDEDRHKYKCHIVNIYIYHLLVSFVK